MVYLSKYIGVASIFCSFCTLSLPFTINFCVAQVDDPSFSTKTVVSSISDQSGKLAPGTLITIRGLDLSATGETCIAKGPLTTSGDICNSGDCLTGYQLPTELCGIQVTTEDKQAFPLYFVSPDEIRLQIPFNVSLGDGQLCVIHGKIPTATREDQETALEDLPGTACEDITIKAQAPVLSVDKSFAIAFHEDGTVVNTGSPARVGEKITVSAGGLGKSRPATKDGSFAVAGATVKKPTIGLVSNDGKTKYKTSVVTAEKQTGTIGLDQVKIKIPKIKKLANGKVTNLFLQFSSTSKKGASNKVKLPIVDKSFGTPTPTATANPTVVATRTFTPTPTITATFTPTATPTNTPVTCLVPLESVNVKLFNCIILSVINLPANQVCRLEQTNTGLETACPNSTLVYRCASSCWVRIATS